MNRHDEKPQVKRYVRKISLDSLSAAGASEYERPAKKQKPERDLLQLTVRGLARGAVRLEAEGGEVYTASKEGARGTL